VTREILVVGYGNVLRGDDGVGWAAADRVAHDPRLDGVTIVRLHQLTPELALDVSEARLVVLIDASGALPAGEIAVAEVPPAAGARTTWSHHLEPPTLLALAAELYGRTAPTFTVSVGIASLEAGDQLSTDVEAAVPRVVDAVAELIAARAAGHAMSSVPEARDA
jgi:hydrogenase maturation protease